MRVDLSNESRPVSEREGEPRRSDLGEALDELYNVISVRREKRPDGSYTTYLFNSGLDKILKKIAEEAGEVIIAAKNDSSERIAAESADLLYHLLVLLCDRGISLAEIREELLRRRSDSKHREAREQGPTKR